MKATFTHMMIIAMMTLGTATGFAKTTVHNNGNGRNEARTEVRHNKDCRHDHGNCHSLPHHRAPHMMPARPMERTVTVVEFRGMHERPKRCTVCKHHLHKGERHTHVVRVMR